MSKLITIELPSSLLARVRKAAANEFETPATFIPMVLARALPESVPRTILRDGGKPPARKLLRPLKPRTKRARIVRWFMESTSPTVSAAKDHFRCSREVIFAALTALHHDHGIGYAFNAASDKITLRVPPLR